jgi:tetratricopeptide (TPR) repeat protein
MHLRAANVATQASWALYETSHIEDAAEKINRIRKVAEDYPNTPAGRFAGYLAANTLYEEGSFEEAIKAFEQFLKKNPDHLLAPSAVEAIGFSRESLGQWDEALKTYKDLIKKRPESPAAARVNYRIGLCYEKLGQDDNAIKAYEITNELLPGSLWAQYATERLSELGPAVPALPTEEALETLMEQPEPAAPDDTASEPAPEPEPAETAPPQPDEPSPPAEQE